MFAAQQTTTQAPTTRRSRAARFLGTLAVAAALAIAVAGPASASTGFEGRHVDQGAQCWYNELVVNTPQIYAFDATTAVDQQWVAFRPEIWRFNETTSAWELFQTDPTGWDITLYDDGTQYTYMTIGGKHTFHITVPGSYKAAIRYEFGATEVTPAGSAYEWVEAHYNTDLAVELDLGGVPQGQYCTF